MARDMNFAAKVVEKGDEIAEKLGEKAAPQAAVQKDGERVKLTVTFDRALRDDLKVWCITNGMTMGEFFELAARHRDRVKEL